MTNWIHFSSPIVMTSGITFGDLPTIQALKHTSNLQVKPLSMLPTNGSGKIAVNTNIKSFFGYF